VGFRGVAVADDGTPLGAVRSFLWNAVRLVDGVEYWSVAVLPLRGDGKRIGDVVGETLVAEGESERRP